ncbi:MAG TPA: PilN domain-containing protein [Pseudomonadales bacterium]|nr:PilN domain-containing protein [Pseudomonadales bacterium]
MAKINLLPWRQERRNLLKRQFLVILAGSAIFGGALVYFADVAVSSQIALQQQRNHFIQDEAAKLDSQIAEIKALQEQRKRLIERMKIIQELQGNRPVIVRIFDELVRTMPDGVYYTKLTRTADTFNAEGYAESNNRVSNLMRNLDASPWFKEPALSKVEALDQAKLKPGEKAPTDEEGGSRFVLSFKLEKPNTDEEGGAKK